MLFHGSETLFNLLKIFFILYLLGFSDELFNSFHEIGVATGAPFSERTL